MSNGNNDNTTPRQSSEDKAIMDEQGNEQRRLFYVEVDRQLSGADNTTKPFTTEAFNVRFNIIRQYKSGVPVKELNKDNPQANKYVKKFDILSVGRRCFNTDSNTTDAATNTETLIYRQSDGVALESYKEVSHYNTVFDDIMSMHLPDHVKRSSLHNRCKEKFADSIPLWACIAFQNFCPVCIMRLKKKKPKAGNQPIVIKGFSVHGQIDLIDLQMMPDGPFKFLCHYQDHGIKFGVLCPLIQKTCRAVAWVLFNIFTLIGPPKTLQSDNGREFNKGACGGKARQVMLDDAVSSTYPVWLVCEMLFGLCM